MLYVHQYPDWTRFRYDGNKVLNQLGNLRKLQGKLMAYGDICNTKELEQQLIATEIYSNYAIDGINLDLENITKEVINPTKATPHYIINYLGAIHNAKTTLTLERIFNWHSALSKKNTFRFRTVDNKITTLNNLSFVGPHHENLNKLVQNFLTWLETSPLDSLIKTAIAHFWFLTLRPFEEANGKLCRMITALQLTRSSDSPKYLYPINQQILNHQEDYFKILNQTQHSSGDITPWILWFLERLHQAIENSLGKLTPQIKDIQFKQRFSKTPLNLREQQLVEAITKGNLTEPFSSQQVASFFKTSHDTALRHIQSLINKGILTATSKKGRSQKYHLQNLEMSW